MFCCHSSSNWYLFHPESRQVCNILFFFARENDFLVWLLHPNSSVFWCCSVHGHTKTTPCTALIVKCSQGYPFARANVEIALECSLSLLDGVLRDTCDVLLVWFPREVHWVLRVYSKDWFPTFQKYRFPSRRKSHFRLLRVFVYLLYVNIRKRGKSVVQNSSNFSKIFFICVPF